MKKVLALVLALMMAISLMVTANAAVVFSDADEINPKYQEAVDVLAQLGIIEGIPDDKSESDSADTINKFEPTKAFDRASFAKILFILYTGADPKDEQFAKYATYSTFEDIPDGYKSWALVPINYLNEIGVMIGVGNGKFEPTRAITGFEVVRGLLQAIGRGKLGEFDGPWSESVIEVAREGAKRNITTGLGLTLSKELKREEVAGLVFNTLTSEEAYKVTYTEGTGYYVEEGKGYNQEKMTLGEFNWELHLYNPTSGHTYPSDKQIDKDLKLDQFGRPTNPKWVAVVNGKPVQIGTENKAVETYYQRDKITRSELEDEFYRLFAFKDQEANIEFYVDGVKDSDPWEYAYKLDTKAGPFIKLNGVYVEDIYEHEDDGTIKKEDNGDLKINKDRNGNTITTYGGANHYNYDFDNFQIGGTGVTIELYLMADEKVAITEDLYEKYLSKNHGNTDIEIDPERPDWKENSWPKIRVVMVHHYAALIDENMFIHGTTFSDQYGSPDRLALPYDKFVGWSDDHTTRKYDLVNEILPLNKADSTYKPTDAIFFSVAISGDKYTVVDDINLTTANDGAYKLANAKVQYAAPDCSYIRLADKDDEKKLTPALYFNYFMQNTKTAAYNANPTNVKAAVKNTMDVYLDPLAADKNFVTLIDFGGEKETPHPAEPSGYTYITDIKVDPGKSYTAKGDLEYSIDFIATGYDAITGAPVTGINLDKEYAEGYLKPTEDNHYWYIETIGGMTVKLIIDAENGKVVGTYDTTGTTAIATVRSEAETEDLTYRTVEDTTVYVVADDVVIYLNDSNDYKTLDPMVLAVENEPVADANKNPVYFVMYNGTAYVLDTYHPVKLEDPTAPAKTTAIDQETVAKTFTEKTGFRAYSTLAALQEATKDQTTKPFPDTIKLPAFNTITVKDNAYAPIINGKDDGTGKDEDKTVYKFDELLYQFVKDGKFALGVFAKNDGAAYEVDAVSVNTITSGILHKNETSSIVTVNGTDYYVDSETTVYSLNATDKKTDAKGNIIGYDRLSRVGIYKYWEFERFGAEDGSHVLVTLVKVGGQYIGDQYVGGQYRVSYISVISANAEPYNNTNVFYGIYCGLDERGASSLVYYLDASQKMQGAPLANSVYYDKLLKHDVGDVLKFTTNEKGEITDVSELVGKADPKETVIDSTANYILITDKDGSDHVYNLYNPVFYYVGAGYISSAKAKDVARADKISVYQAATANGPVTVVVIYSEAFENSLKYGNPYTGQIELDWVGDNVNP